MKLILLIVIVLSTVLIVSGNDQLSDTTKSTSLFTPAQYITEFNQWILKFGKLYDGKEKSRLYYSLQ
ncbi:hypothetical protein DFA_02021 [Cavenderia fasciculata]|uniref:Cathepsin propeptide inhibitor domain-containing protein n=1 Tax=Cavenderia fasciculata TaxID=261658 RepID=F4PYH0_CACFS|nr:uncharacterized protein DFA_02021 [Cavenderia fasciculata]EGG19236.1 hypothetical protein DFA_02021 [Cavenderia fasciculata]|eukprot:XP_004357507.1 hypothetical protein DFA_02021 [Cavenderia fasciculata]